MTNGLLIYGEIFAHFLIYKEALHHTVYDFAPGAVPSEFLGYEENFVFFLISA
jgi:hypothetical protein